MIAIDVSVRKMDPKEERFPAWDSIKRSDGSIMGFSEVYLCEMKTMGVTDGEQDATFECPFLLTDALMARHTRQEVIAMMMESFARAIRNVGKVEVAA